MCYGSGKQAMTTRRSVVQIEQRKGISSSEPSGVCCLNNIHKTALITPTINFIFFNLAALFSVTPISPHRYSC